MTLQRPSSYCRGITELQPSPGAQSPAQQHQPGLPVFSGGACRGTASRGVGQYASDLWWAAAQAGARAGCDAW